MIVRKAVSIVSTSAQKCIDNFPPPLFLSCPRYNALVAGKTGCPLSLNLFIMNSATRSHSPPGLSLSVGFHFVSDPGPRNDQYTSMEFAIHSVSLYGFHHVMSLYIDMKIIRPWIFSGSPISFMNFWTSKKSGNVVILGKIFHSNSIGSPSIVSNVLYCGESSNHFNCCSQAVLDSGC